MDRLLVLELRRMFPRAVLALLIVLLGLALALLPWKWAAGLVVGGIGLVGLLLRPQYVLCLLALAVPFGSIWTWQLGPVNVGAAEALVVLLLSCWLAQGIARRRIVIPRPPLVLPLLIFVAALLLSTLGAVSLELSAKEIAKWVQVLIVYLFMSAAVDEGSAKWVVGTLLLAGSAEAAVGIYQFLRQIGPEGFVLFGRFMRAHGHFGQPNPFAGYLGLGIPLAYALALQLFDRGRALPKDIPHGHSERSEACPEPGRRESQPHPATNLSCATGVYLIGAAAVVIMLAGMVMSWSRGGWIGVAAALLVVTVARSRRALVVAVVIGLVLAYWLLVGGAQYLPPALLQRVSDFIPYLSGVDVTRVEVTDANWAIIERMAHWWAAIGMFSDHPWGGVGIGNYPVAYAQYALSHWRDPLGHAHNYYLNLAAETGLVGLSAYLILFVVCFAQAWRVIRRTRGYWRAVALGVLGVLVHLSVHNLFDNLYVHSMNIQLALMLGLLSVAAGSKGSGHADRD
ncbi:MAG TPA: O-antigen ligase family protein [Anaerolineae bacterium]|nr:O-antigen ligase family protein [Anaerolineae bacterium]